MISDESTKPDKMPDFDDENLERKLQENNSKAKKKLKILSIKYEDLDERDSDNASDSDLYEKTFDIIHKEINTSINSKSALKRNSYSNHSSQVRKHIKPKTLTSVTTVSNESSEGMPHYSNESNEMIRSDSEINTVISDSSKPNDINNNTIAEESKIESIEEKLQTIS